MSWDPVTHPYRVTIMLRGRHLPHGWHSTVKGTYATLEEARAAMNEPLPAGGTEAKITLALNAETWAKNGRWKMIASRRRRK